MRSRGCDDGESQSAERSVALLNLRVGTQRSGRAKMRGVEKEQLAFGKVTWNVNGALTNVARGRGSCCIDFAVEFRPRAHGSSWPVHCPKSDKAREYVREVPRWSERCKLRRTARKKSKRGFGWLLWYEQGTG